MTSPTLSVTETNAGQPGTPLTGGTLPGSVLDTATTTYKLHAIKPDGTSILLPFDGLAWEELAGEVATRITVTLPETIIPDGTRLADLVTLGTPINVLAALGDAATLVEVCRGVVEDVAPNDGAGGTFQVIAYDPLRALLTNKDDLFFPDGQTPGALIRNLTDKWKIPVGDLDPLLETVTLPVQIIHGQTLADILISWLQQSYDLGLARLVTRTTDGHLEVVRAGTNQVVYWVRLGESVMRVPERLSSMEVITRVVVLGRGSTMEASPVVATLDAIGADPATYGVRQDMIHMTARKSEAQIRVAALTILNEKGRVRQDRSVEAPDIPMLRKSDRLRVTAGTMDGYFSVESITHNAEPAATMRVVLGLLQLMTVEGVFTMVDPSGLDGLPDNNPTGTDTGSLGTDVVGINDARLYALAINAGFSPNDAITAVAISIAEDRSSDPTARGKPNSNGTVDLGLWQINSVHWATYGGEGALVDPVTNARAAYDLWKARGNFTAWATFNDGTYKGFLNRATSAASAPADTSAVTTASAPATAGGNARLMAAIQPWLGTPYRMGGASKAGVDCSAFTQAVFSELGVNLPRTALAQYNATPRTNTPNVGDLVFFARTYVTADWITHVGIYVGNDQMISASDNGVAVQALSGPFWQAHFAGYGHMPGTGATDTSVPVAVTTVAPPSGGPLNIVDIVAQLPRSGSGGPNQSRALSAITIFGWHWDGGPPIPTSYAPVAYYQGEAQFHIGKDWGGGSTGDGLMYHGKLARDGTLYITRALTDIVWAAMGANGYGMWVCVDATFGSPLTDAQKEALPLVEAEFMRRLGRTVPVTMHGLLKSAGNSTQCAGPDILAYLTNTGRAGVR